MTIGKKMVLALVGFITLLVVTAGVFLHLPRMWNDVRGTYLYNVGDEIPNYPVANVYANFTAYNITSQFTEHGLWLDAKENSTIAVFSFTIRNGSNKTMGLSGELLKHPIQMPELVYRLTNEDGAFSSYGADVLADYSIRWIDCLLSDEPVRSNGLMKANQTAQGIFVFSIPKQGQIASLHLKTPQANIEGMALHMTPQHTS